jgi:hypothetical protein
LEGIAYLRRGGRDTPSPTAPPCPHHRCHMCSPPPPVSHGTHRARRQGAPVSVDIMHGTWQVAQERKCIQDGNSGAQPPHLTDFEYLCPKPVAILLLTMRSLLLTVLNGVEQCSTPLSGLSQKGSNQFFPKEENLIRFAFFLHHLSALAYL